MPPRPATPSDDLYATLGVPVDASPEAIEIAWRGLLRRHHPDVAGDEGLALAKRIIENYHQGRLFVKTSEVGKGTTFRLILSR